jgi:peroxiredoxin
VSPDPQDRSDAFRKTLDLPYPLVGDATGAIVKSYDVRRRFVGGAWRTTYVVGRDRRIQSAHWSELAPVGHATQACAIASAGKASSD